MKVAVCFYGLHPDECWKINGALKHDTPPIPDQCLSKWQENVLSNIDADVDVFLHSFSKMHDRLLEYQPVRHMFEDVETFKANMRTLHSEDIKDSKTDVLYNLNIYEALLLITHGIQKSYNLMHEYQIEANVKYDLVLISRIDCCWLTPLKFSELDVNKFYSQLWGYDNYHGRKNNGCLGYWFMSNVELMRRYANIHDHIMEIAKETQDWHVITKAYIDEYIGCEISYKFQDEGAYSPLYAPVTIDCELQRFLYLKNRHSLKQLNMPRVIHQIWLGGAIDTKKMAMWRDTHVPLGFKYILWDINEIQRRLKEDRSFAGTFGLIGHRFHEIEDLEGKIHILRWLILYEYGGVFCDADCECVEPIHPEMMKTAFSKSNISELSLDCVGFPPNHPLVAHVINHISENQMSLTKTRKPSGETVGLGLLSRVYCANKNMYEFQIHIK